MSERETRRRGGKRSRDRMKGPGADRQPNSGDAPLEHRILLAMGEVRASLPSVLVIKEMVDQVRRKRDQVRQEEARPESSADESTSDKSIGPAHRRPIIHDAPRRRCHRGDGLRAPRAKTP